MHVSQMAEPILRIDIVSSILAKTDGSASYSLDLESLKRRCLGRIDLVHRVLETFCSSAESDIALLKQAIGARRWSEAAQLAHRVKGSSLSVSASQLAEYSRQLERCVKSVAAGQVTEEAGDIRLLDTLLADLRQEYASVGEAIQRITGGSRHEA